MSEDESECSVGDEKLITSKEKAKKNYRVWTKKEELELLDVMKNAKMAGLKSKLGFKPDGYMFIQAQLNGTFPGTDLKVKPHIQNRIRAWKAYHADVLALKNKSGIGWCDIEKRFNCEDHVWKDYVNVLITYTSTYILNCLNLCG